MRRTIHLTALVCVLAVAAQFNPGTALALDGTWTRTTTGGNWSDSSNWFGGTIADGSGFTADFSTIDIAGNSATITAFLDSSRTIGHLEFGDNSLGFNAGNFQISPSSVEVLTLDTGGGTPSITATGVNLNSDMGAFLNVVLAGSEGVNIAKGDANGINPIVFKKANTYTGTTTLLSQAPGSGPVLVIEDDLSLGPVTNAVVIEDGAQLRLKYTTTARSIEQDITIEDGGGISSTGGNSDTGTIHANSTLTIDSGTARFAGLGTKNQLIIDTAIGENTAGSGVEIFGISTLGSNRGNVLFKQASTYTGPTTVVHAGTAKIDHADAFGTAASTVTVSGTSLINSAPSANLTISNLAGSLNANKTLDVGEFGQLILEEGVSLSNTINLDQGTIRFSSAGSGTILLTGTINLATGSQSTIHPTSPGSGTTLMQTGTISGDGSLFYKGQGSSHTATTTIAGNNNYTGGTLVQKINNQRQIFMGHDNAFGIGLVTIEQTGSASSAFALNASRTLANDLTGAARIDTAAFVLTTTGEVAPGTSIGEMTIDDLDFRGTYNFEYDTDGGDILPQDSDVIVTDTLVFGDGTADLNVDWIGLGDPGTGDYVLFTYTGADPTNALWTINAPGNLTGMVFVDANLNQVLLTLTAQAVPEPSTAMLLGLGMLAIVGRMRRKRA